MIFLQGSAMNLSKQSKTIFEHILFPSKNINQDKLNKTISNKVILITGATYGIGESLVYMLAHRGVTLILVARTEDKLLKIKKDLEVQGSIVYTYTANLQDAEQVDNLLEYIGELSLDIDIFVSNAGKSIRRSLWESLDRFHDYTRTMSLNYYAPVKLLLGLAPALAKRKGQIVNVSAVNVLLAPAPYWAAYQASKSAFDNWLRSCIPELRAKGVAVTSIYLPLVRTRMIEPTKAYNKVPAMQPAHAAQIICKAIIKRSRRYSPWWIVFPQLASILFRNLWESVSTYYIIKKGE